MNRIPTFMSEITQPSAKGITAQVITGRTKAIIGARKNTALSAPAGTTISLTMYFRKSAKLCSRPKAPTTFGPLRICTAAQILRSAYIRNARLVRIRIVTSRHWASTRMKMPKPVSKNAIALLRRQGLPRPLGRQPRELGHHLARAGDRVGQVVLAHRQPRSAPGVISPRGAGVHGFSGTSSMRPRCGTSAIIRARSAASVSKGSGVPSDARERAQDRPVLARLARGEAGAVRHLRAALGVDEDARLLGIGRARAGSRRPGARRGRRGCPGRSRTAPRAGRSRRRRGCRPPRPPSSAAASPPSVAKPRSIAPTRAAAVCSTRSFAPAASASAIASPSTAAPSGRVSAAWPSTITGLGAAAQQLQRPVAAVAGQGLGAGAEMRDGIGQVDVRADQRRPRRRCVQALRMRALSTGASARGLAPTIRTARAASRSSIRAVPA